MNGQRLTDTQISMALRAHLPDAAAPGLRERVFASAETTSQQRALPSFLGALSDADPVSRRRSLLIAAALLLAVALASAAAVGAWRLFQRDPVDELSLEPPADLPAFVLSSYERLPQLPPLALTWHDSDSTKGRIYVDRSGAVRFDRFASADATEPASYRILSPDHRISGMAPVESEPVWVEQGHEAIGEDPRVFIRTVLSADEGPGCEMERDPSDVGNATVAAGWRYIGTEYVAGRPTHHVACVGDLWIDIETRLILRTQGPAVDDAGQPIPVEFTEVAEIAFGEQPAELFEAPEGVTRMSADAYNGYICMRNLPNEMAPGISDCPTSGEAEATPPPDPSPTPMPAERPITSSCAVPSGDPGEPPGPLAWTQASLKEDWPAPVRSEPASGASVLPMPPTYTDPSGDTGSDVLPCIDIRHLTVDTYDVFLDLASIRPPEVEPSEAWIAYGVVVDDDRDGIPDWRYGIDNLPRTAGDESSHHREWRTDLDTGRTEWAVEKDFAMYFATGFNSGYPGYADREGFYTGRDGARFRFGHVFDTTGGTKTRGFKVDMPLYAWASVIVNGRVVATDYAPDTGWLLPSPGATPGGTYVLRLDRLPVPHLSMTILDGWRAGGSIDGVLFDGASTLTRESGKTGLAFVIVDNPANEACAQEGTIDPPLGPGVHDLVTFLAALPSIDISESKDVTLDGYRGTYLEFNKDGGTERECAFGTNSSSLRYVDGYHQVWILDVDGVRLVIDAFSQAPSETVKSELRQIVESIHFEL